MQRTDPDVREQIDAFVDAFYERMLADPLLAPLFIEVARIELAEHLPRIKAYWRKMLLGDSEYQRHMMRKHREVDARQVFADEHYQRWLFLFEETLAKHPLGVKTDSASELARRVAGNMRQNLKRFRA
ncbi:group III truncated hemoglobin [Congregibacter variabilis]|uniref:Group III truncated hemoglobin n=1 Tax=Congregibacter variabilis TaxID=3081200 RepID=A0ABZ0I3R5_9GAMM|nr:group III truncated hemoglobin [Congregibacter sp. IMCC43200]